jgi:glycosyltransferase involved in cell wall biosynthesis
MTATDSKLPISCYIRTLNEAALIARTITAALAVADEVVILDSGSSDRTIALAEAAGARVIRQPWLGLGAQKRAGEEACRHDWLLDLDADEVVSLALAEEIHALFRHGEPGVKIHELKLVTAPPVGKPWPFQSSYRRKLYDRRAIRMPDHKAWDQLQVAGGTKVGRLHGDLLHYSFRDFAHMVEKYNRASTMMAQDGRGRSVGHLRIRVLFALPFYLVKHFFIRGLWRAGVYGFALAGIAAYGRWLRDVKQYEIHRQRDDGK